MLNELTYFFQTSYLDMIVLIFSGFDQQYFSLPDNPDFHLLGLRKFKFLSVWI